ncbi:MAG: hypothetical protein SF339_24170 [Blastocatellia bacterium]|nr:hypothetical protein [Blastocatellia bacterium]
MIRRIIDHLAQKQGTILRVILGLLVLLFIGIIFTVYMVARQADPVFLDENGKPTNVRSHH